MFSYKNQRGLTLIEIIMALAIAGLLAATVLTGRDNLRSQVQFGQAADQAVQVLSTARGEAAGTVGSQNLAAGGTTIGDYVVGKWVQISGGTSDFHITTVTQNAAGALTTNVDPYTVTIPWGAKAASNAAVYFQLTSNGTVQAYSGSPSAPAPIPPGGYPIHLNSLGSQTAILTVDALGNVTRVIN